MLWTAADCGTLSKLLSPGETPELLFEEVLVPAGVKQVFLQTWLTLHAVACSDGERKGRAFALLALAHLVAPPESERQAQNVLRLSSCALVVSSPILPLVTSRVATHQTSSVIVHSRTRSTTGTARLENENSCRTRPSQSVNVKTANKHSANDGSRL